MVEAIVLYVHTFETTDQKSFLCGTLIGFTSINSTGLGSDNKKGIILSFS
jgi:hypothetical protein